MSLGVSRSFTSFDSLFRFFSDADEIVFQLGLKIDDQELACLCREARQQAAHLHKHFGACQTGELARFYGVEIAGERYQSGEKQVLSLAECSLQPPKINLNLDSIEILAAYGQSVADSDQMQWFTLDHITEVATAYELYHIIRRHGSSRSIEIAAHCFARAFTDTPFSSLLYHSLLQQRALLQQQENFGSDDVLLSRH